MSCLALAAFEWPEALDTRFEPIEGWIAWEQSMNRANAFVPTLRTLREAKEGAAPWLPVAQGSAMDITGPSLRGRPPVAWANNFVARRRRASQSVSRLLMSVCTHARPAAGPSVTAGGENVDITPDFTAVCGSQTEQIIDGRINLDQPDGHVNSHRDDKTLNITLTEDGAKDVAAQYVMGYTSYRPDTNEPKKVTRVK
eukprot:8643035-Pyramimonas_sp.AAC.1